MAVPVLMLFLLVQQLRWLLYRCSESVAAAVIMADGQIAQCMSGVVSPIHVFLILTHGIWNTNQHQMSKRHHTELPLWLFLC